MNSYVKSALLALVRVYQVFISPMIHVLAGPGYGCRFIPSCSEYAHEALCALPTDKAVKKIFSRVLRCRPGCPAGYDPVLLK